METWRREIASCARSSVAFNSHWPRLLSANNMSFNRSAGHSAFFSRIRLTNNLLRFAQPNKFKLLLSSIKLCYLLPANNNRIVLLDSWRILFRIQLQTKLSARGNVHRLFFFNWFCCVERHKCDGECDWKRMKNKIEIKCKRKSERTW